MRTSRTRSERRSALAKQLVEERTTGTTQLVRELAQTGGTGFGFFGSPDKVESETLEALRSSIALLGTKAPEEQEPYRKLVLDVAERVAEAKGGVSDKETGSVGEDQGRAGRRSGVNEVAMPVLVEQ